jgi:mono/diheme cytochrome c family protein
MVLVKVSCCVAATVAMGCAQQAAEKIDFFERKIRPVLTNNCYSCHTDTKLGGLQVDSRVALLSGGKSGPAIKVGNPDDSLLIRAVMHVDPSLKMPLGASKLKDNEIADLKYWIQTGAVWPDALSKSGDAPVAAAPKFSIRPEQRKFWSFQPKKPPFRRSKMRLGSGRRSIVSYSRSLRKKI